MQENSPIKQAFPELDISGTIRQDALSKATDLSHRYRQKQVRRRASAYLFGVLSFGVLALSLGPKAYAYYRFEQISNSITDCKTAVTEDFSIMPDGSAKPSGKTIYSNGNWRLERNGKISIFKDMELWSFIPEEKKVTKRFKPEGPYAFNPSGFSVKSMISDLARWNWKDTKVTTGSTEIDGKTVDVITFEQDSYFPSRTIFYASRETHMPFRMESMTVKDGDWKMSRYATLKFDVPLDATTFDTKFPPGTRIVDADTMAIDWAKKLETPIASMGAPHRTIAVRDWYVNDRGDIFVIYTDGESSDELNAVARRSGPPPNNFRRSTHILVEDSTGMSYFESEYFQPYVNSINGNKNPWIVLKDGQVLQGALLIPAETNGWRPRELTFKARIPLDPYNDEFSQKWTLKVGRASTALLPDWIDLCAMAPRSTEDLLKEEQRAQRDKGEHHGVLPNHRTAK